MRGPKPGFWRKYEAQQTFLVASCMPRTAVLSGDKPMAIKALLCGLPSARPTGSISVWLELGPPCSGDRS